MSHDATNERLAAMLCDLRWGQGTFKKGGIQRSYWRRQARKLHEAEREKLLKNVPEHYNYLLEDV